ncbi:MAG: OsmC family protein [Bacteroidetes bacterium]|nr:OsmC family protein [Bacteroidota bacterium]
METVRIEYKGDLRTECTHVKSGQVLITDAPVDNNGKGMAFSPTDLLATAYGSCMLTIVGIYCKNHEVEMNHGYVTVEKIMVSDPRRVGCLNIILDFSGNNWDAKTQKKVELAAMACPVAKSVDPLMLVQFTFKFQ